MKPSMRPSIRPFALLLAGGIVAGCGDRAEAPLGPEALLQAGADPSVVDQVHGILNIGQFVPDLADEDCNVPSQIKDPRTPLYLIPFADALLGVCDGKFPIVAPDGHQVVLREWVRARGKVRISCEDGGTRYQFHFRGLIPNGVYTIWNFTPTGAGALASHPPDDINNVFSASPIGAANFTTFGTAGPMTFFGAVSDCTLPVPLKSEITSDPTGKGVLFVVLYHTDGQSWGPFPGPEETGIAHVVFTGK